MPYVTQDKRDALDPVIEDLITALRGLQSDDPQDNTEGNLNYVLARILDKMYVANYKEINNALGMLLATALEYYRRVAAPYEDQKRFENDDVYTTDTTIQAVERYVSDHADD